MNAQDMIREAKRLERKMGLTVTQQVENTTTGEQKILPVKTIGLPVPGAQMDPVAIGSSLALLGTALWGVKIAVENWGRAELSKNPRLAKERKMKAIGGMAMTTASVGIMMPIQVDKLWLDKINPLKTEVLVG